MLILRDEGSCAILYDTDTLKFQTVTDPPWPRHDRLILARARACNSVVPSAPVRVYWEVTRRCNLACRHCFVCSSPNAFHGLPTALLLRLMASLRDMGVIDLRFTGGEVTTRADWRVLLRSAVDMGFVVSLNTNAVYEHPGAVVESLASLGLAQVTVSLDGVHASHDAIRGHGTYARAISALKAMRAAGVRTRVNCVLTRINVDDALRLLDVTAPFVEEINFFWMRPVGRGHHIARQMITFDSYQTSASAVLAARDRYPSVRIMHREQAISEQAVSAVGPAHTPGVVVCLPAGVTTMNVSADGRYWVVGYNAYQDARLSFGRFPRDDVHTAWLHSPVVTHLRAFQCALLERCRDCTLFGVACPGANLEMEVAAQMGVIQANPYCINPVPVPTLWNTPVT